MKAGGFLRHGHPFLLLDEVEGLEVGKWARGYKNVSIGEPCVEGTGALPPYYIVEAMAQLSGIASGKRGGGYLSAVRDFKSFSPAAAGGRLVIESRFESSFGGLYSFRAEAYLESVKVAEATLILQLLG